jgi:hypothetical protein
MRIRCTSFAKWFRLTMQICAVLILHERLYAQTVLHTDPALTNATTYGTVTFNFENTNPFPVIITDISGIVSEFGSQLVEIWFKPTPVNGAPGMINAGNGWQPGGSGTTAGVANTSTSAIQPLLGGLGISVPANTTYGFALSAHFNGTGTLRGSAFTTNPVASAGGCNIIMNATSSFADPQPLASAPATPSVGPVVQCRRRLLFRDRALYAPEHVFPCLRRQLQACPGSITSGSILIPSLVPGRMLPLAQLPY